MLFIRSRWRRCIFFLSVTLNSVHYLSLQFVFKVKKRNGDRGIKLYKTTDKDIIVIIRSEIWVFKIRNRSIIASKQQ